MTGRGFNDRFHFDSSSFEWNSAPFDIPDLFSKPGTPCNQYTGYCDVFQMCREVSGADKGHRSPTSV